MPPSALIFILQSFIHHILVHGSISSHLHPPIIYPSHPPSCLHQLSSSSSNHLSSTSLLMPPSALSTPLRDVSFAQYACTTLSVIGAGASLDINCSLTVRAVRSTLRARTHGNHLTVIWLSLDRDKPLV